MSSSLIEGLLPRPLPRRAPQGMRTFTVARVHDQTGVSGTGIVAEGVEFACGKAVVHWLTPWPLGDVQVKDSLDIFLQIHVLPHPENITVITFSDGRQDIYPHGAQIPEGWVVE
jgi:hypothetical protein